MVGLFLSGLRARLTLFLWWFGFLFSTRLRMRTHKVSVAVSFCFYFFHYWFSRLSSKGRRWPLLKGSIRMCLLSVFKLRGWPCRCCERPCACRPWAFTCRFGYREVRVEVVGRLFVAAGDLHIEHGLAFKSPRHLFDFAHVDWFFLIWIMLAL